MTRHDPALVKDKLGTGCTAEGAPAGTPCDDSDPATAADACTGGPQSTCAGVLPACPNNGLPCTVEVEADGGCATSIAAGTCFVDDACWDDGATHPSAPCLVCSGATPDAWSAVANDTPCDARTASAWRARRRAAPLWTPFVSSGPA